MLLSTRPLCVLDASIAGGWIFPAQSTDYKKRVLDAVNEASALVPALWHTEVANMLVKRRVVAKLSLEVMQPLMVYFDHLPVVTEELDNSTASRAKNWKISKQVELAFKYELTSYDATYLALAMRSNLPLASADEALIQAAHKSGVAIFQP
jgi:predicted nucleic acid-binding protein